MRIVTVAVVKTTMQNVNARNPKAMYALAPTKD